ncbi:hypothetical protein Mgra_00008574 [Meloidogyne graminicola]|uniref:Uncharacterized protein n=1 Tax=Meloidogyne graminicola TaxID=189291 RepID=A0A8S9ZFG9_9BILA|nr:hypothetical protein Mgra_00008574 [Meloidogyne graminicola]
MKKLLLFLFVWFVGINCRHNGKIKEPKHHVYVKKTETNKGEHNGEEGNYVDIIKGMKGMVNSIEIEFKDVEGIDNKIVENIGKLLDFVKQFSLEKKGEIINEDFLEAKEAALELFNYYLNNLKDGGLLEQFKMAKIIKLENIKINYLKEIIKNLWESLEEKNGEMEGINENLIMAIEIWKSFSSFKMPKFECTHKAKVENKSLNSLTSFTRLFHYRNKRDLENSCGCARRHFICIVTILVISAVVIVVGTIYVIHFLHRFT